MNPETFFEKWKSDVEMLEGAYVTIQHKKSCMLWFPICFCIMGLATILILMFISYQFDIHFKYVILYAVFGFYQIFVSMNSEYKGVCDDELAAYDTICLLHSLSPELLIEYMALSKNNDSYHSHGRLGYITVTATLLQKHELSKNY